MADYEKEKKKIKKKTEKLSIMGAGPSPLRMLGRYLENKRRKKQRQKELAALPMKVDDFRVRKNMGGVMRNRGGTFKGVY